MIESSAPLKTKTAVGILLLLISLMIISYFLPQLDLIAGWQNRDDKTTVKTFQFISDSISFISFGVPVVLALFGEFSDKKKETRIALFYVVLSIALAGALSYLLKKTFLVPRPYEIDKRIAQLSVGGGYSFPSGHTTEAFASATALALLFPRWFVFILVFTWSMSVALSRVYLGVHYPFDVIAGMVIGSAVSFLLYNIFARRITYFPPGKTENKNQE